MLLRCCLFSFFLLILLGACNLSKKSNKLNSNIFPIGDFQSSKIESRDKQLNSTEIINWPWKVIGPNSIPKEHKSAGSSLPTYSQNRGNGTGRIQFIFIDPNNNSNVFACSGSGGLFVTYDKGLSWLSGGTDKLPVSGVGSFSMHPHDIHTWVISTGDSNNPTVFSDGIWITRDSGKSWNNINGISENNSFPVSESSWNYTYISKVLFHPSDPNMLFVACNRGLFMSNNILSNPKKVSWKRVDDLNYYDIEIPSWNTDLVVASGTTLLMSKNKGISWERLDTPNYDDSEKYPFLRMSIEMTSADKRNVFAVIPNNERQLNSKQGEAYLLKFNLDSLKWTTIRSLKTGMDNMLVKRARAFTVSPIDSTLMLTGNIQPIYRSMDGGVSFSPIAKRQMHDDIQHLKFTQDGKEIWAAHDGGVSISFDKGLTWESRGNGIGNANVYGVSVSQETNPIYLFGGLDTGGNLLKNGIWSHISWGDGFETMIDYNNSDVMYSSRQNGYIYRTENGGLTWENRRPRKINSNWHTWMKMNTSNPSIIYSCGENVVRSIDSGNSWETILDIDKMPNIETCYRFFLSEVDANVMYVYLLVKENNSNPIIYRSFNINEENVENIQWERIEDLPKLDWISSIVVDDNDRKNFWLVYNSVTVDEKVFYHAEGIWNDLSLGLGKCNAKSLILEKNSDGRVYLGTTYGVFTRDRSDEKWTLLKGLPGTQIRSMAINYKTQSIVVGTEGRGIWEGDLFKD